jgi:hypothetical protein
MTSTYNNRDYYAKVMRFALTPGTNTAYSFDWLTSNHVYSGGRVYIQRQSTIISLAKAIFMYGTGGSVLGWYY